MIFSKKRKQVNLETSSHEKFLSTLFRIGKILKKWNHTGQSKIIDNLITYLENNEIDDFSSLLNSADMWGGSGAVWEISISDKKEEKDFEFEIITLITMMEEAGLLRKKGIKGVRKIFEKNLQA